MITDGLHALIMAILLHHTDLIGDSCSLDRTIDKDSRALEALEVLSFL